MKTKILEIRDRSTMISVICIDMNPDSMSGSVADHKRFDVQRYYLRGQGYECDGRPNIAIAHLRASGDPFWNDPFGWKGRTYPVAHTYIIENWGKLSDGDVVDVEFILGETETKKESERYGQLGSAT